MFAIHKKIGFLFFGFAILTSCANQTTDNPEKGVSLELANYRKAQLSGVNYLLHLNIPEEKEESISGIITITFFLKSTENNLPLDFKSTPNSVHSVSVNDLAVDVAVLNEHIILPKHALKNGENTVEISFTAGETSLNRNPEYLYTLFVPDRARTAFPLFDQPNLKARFELSLNIPGHWQAVSNAPLASSDSTRTHKILYFEPSDLIPSYLFSFVAGEFESVTRTVNGREMTMLHRETDKEKAARNMDDIFKLHADALQWLETYTGIPYPFKKFDFALIPSFQYGGMEHVGAIQYNASGLFLEENPSDNQLLSRASLIAHETAHMWFGDLVTMDWFNDVWTKEVFANFMAAKIVNPGFPSIDHELSFHLRHFPAAYSIDRTALPNPIRQELPNLNEAGQLYGPVIYNKAPIMMQQLEFLVGEDSFQKGIQEYLKTYSFANATWPNLIEILGKYSPEDLKSWSDVWVNTPGRPVFQAELSSSESQQTILIRMDDPLRKNRIWTQFHSVLTPGGQLARIEHKHQTETLEIAGESSPTTDYFWNASGMGYGLFPASPEQLEKWESLSPLQRGVLLINLRENFLENAFPDKEQYGKKMLEIVLNESNQLLLGNAIGQVRNIFWDYMNETEREAFAPVIENAYLQKVNDKSENMVRKRLFFNAYRGIAYSQNARAHLYTVWKEKLKPGGINLSENDRIGMAEQLALLIPEKAGEILDTQEEEISNTDRKRRFQFVKPSLSPNASVRDAFFESLKQEQNRQVESWVLSGLGNLHHPLRLAESEKYILPSLELLEEIQQTGDIFFPTRWANATLGNYGTQTAAQTVINFLEKRPDYHPQLKMRIVQAADDLWRKTGTRPSLN